LAAGRSSIGIWRRSGHAGSRRSASPSGTDGS
jgi:hypothetical protein